MNVDMPVLWARHSFNPPVIPAALAFIGVHPRRKFLASCSHNRCHTECGKGRQQFPRGGLSAGTALSREPEMRSAVRRSRITNPARNFTEATHHHHDNAKTHARALRAPPPTKKIAPANHATLNHAEARQREGTRALLSRS
jgi:hypothetical protein